MRFRLVSASLFLSLLLLSGIFPSQAHSQQLRSLSEEAEISLITMLPGNAVHELFGHSAIRVHDPIQGYDLLFNYGTFLFDETFLPKFIYGELDYFLSVSYFPREIVRYREDERSVVEQVLRLTPQQEQELFDLLIENEKEENRTYRYDFLFDNCSTRIRDILNHLLADSLQFSNLYDDELTFRQILDPYITPTPLLDFGIDLGLGSPVDEKASSSEVMFLPIYLLEAFDAAEVTYTGIPQTLVARTDTLFWFEEEESNSESSAPFMLLLWLSAFIGVAAMVWQQKWLNSVAGALEWVVWLISGLTGLLIIFLWFFSLHEVTNLNWNLLWAIPTHLLLLIPAIKRMSWAKTYFRATTIGALIVLAGWFFWPQELHMGLIPLLFFIALRASVRGWEISPLAGGRREATA